MADSSIRRLALDALRSRLGLVVRTAGPNEGITPKIVTGNRVLSEYTRPCIVVFKGIERVVSDISNRYHCTIPIVIGFVDDSSAEDPDDAAENFLADIQLALGTGSGASGDEGVNFTVDTKNQQGTADKATIRLLEQQSILNAGDVVEGSIYGEVRYEMKYERFNRNPRVH